MDRFDSTKKAGILGIIGNIFLLIIKATIGIISNSQSMIADSANSAGDIFASLMTYIGNKIAKEPKDSTHNFGHGKAEYIFSLFIGISMIIVSLKLLIDSILSLIFMHSFEPSIALIIVCIITIVTKLLLYLYTNNLSNKFNNILLEANKKDHKNDCIVTTFTLISCILAYYNIFWFDGIVGSGISIWICYTGINIFIESFNVLMDKSLDLKTEELIMDTIKAYKNNKKIDNIESTPVGYQYAVFITIYVDGNMSTFDSHKLADSVEENINNIENIYRVIVHVNPI